MLQIPRWKVDVTVDGDLVKTLYETATTSKAAIAKAKHKLRGAVSSAGAFKFKTAKVAGEPARHHATKKNAAGHAKRDPEWAVGKIEHIGDSSITYHADYGRGHYQIRTRGKGLTGTAKSLKAARQIARDANRADAPALRSASAPHHATKKKSPAQLEREIAEALSKSGKGSRPSKLGGDYFTVVLTRAKPAATNEWNRLPTGWDSQTRGTFPSKYAAFQWAKEKLLPGAPFTVRYVPLGDA